MMAEKYNYQDELRRRRFRQLGLTEEQVELAMSHRLSTAIGHSVSPTERRLENLQQRQWQTDVFIDLICLLAVVTWILSMLLWRPIIIAGIHIPPM
jgi:hypothetical protein